ncbi:MAG: FAD-dependent oxidoreductase [Burkholderiaceae bacterium]|nr:FAD-dependent oxidoreductase [Burkholderiaceae bacterium]
MSRRSFLLGAGAAALSGGAGWWLRRQRFPMHELTPQIGYPGMREGHLLRDKSALPQPSGTLETDVVILGSGVAGLSCAWRLAKSGYRNFLVIDGPEFGGNADGGSFGGLRYPRGAHYLPLPSMESTHVREMLADFGVIEADAMSERPRFDERVLLHAPDERLLIKGEWQEGIVPSAGLTVDEAAQIKRFFQYVDSLKTAKGADGRKLFAIPLALSSQDPAWTRLDTSNVKAWLLESGYTAPSLHWYMDYVCRDEYGTEYGRVSAWCGLHYFASRGGKAANASEGAVLTWSNGLQPLVRHLSGAVDSNTHHASWRKGGFAARVEESASGVEILCAQLTPKGIQTFTVKAGRAVCAMPLMMTAQIVPHLSSYGFDKASHMPAHAPWLVSNFLLNGFPAELKGAALAWDNVAYEGRGLGYVVSTLQDIRVAAPPQTVFSAYQALSKQTPSQARQWLQGATPHELYEEAACDLQLAYGDKLAEHAAALEITVRGHAMASPAPGFLSNHGLAALRATDGKLLFAHADLSSFSVFEEAAWWGCEAARKILD